MEYVLKREMTIRQGDTYAGTRAIKLIGEGVCWETAVTGLQLIISPHRDTCNSTLAQSLIVSGVYTPPAATAAGFVVFELTAAQTNTLAKGLRNYAFEVKGTFAGGIITLAAGLVTVQ
jgi:hypothetical protein